MKLTIEALNILLFLLPGLISGQIFYSLFQSGTVDFYKRLLDAIIFSCLTYVFVSLLTIWAPLVCVQYVGGTTVFSFSQSLWVVFWTLGLSVTIPVFIGYLYHGDFLHSWLRKLNITTKTPRTSTWNDVFLSQDRRVIITLKDESRVRGYPTMFSTDPDEGFLYLYDPVWVDDDKKDEQAPDYIETNCHGFLLHRDNIDLIEFTLNPGEKLPNILQENE